MESPQWIRVIPRRVRKFIVRFILQWIRIFGESIEDQSNPRRVWKFVRIF